MSKSDKGSGCHCGGRCGGHCAGEEQKRREEQGAEERRREMQKTIHQRCKWFAGLCVSVYSLGAFGKLTGMPVGMFAWLLALLILAWMGVLFTDD